MSWPSLSITDSTNGDLTEKQTCALEYAVDKSVFNYMDIYLTINSVRYKNISIY